MLKKMPIFFVAAAAAVLAFNVIWNVTVYIIIDFEPSTETIEVMRDMIAIAGFFYLGIISVTVTITLFVLKMNLGKVPHRLLFFLTADHYLIGTTVVSYIIAVLISSLAKFLESEYVVMLSSAAVLTVSIYPIYLMYVIYRAYIILDPELQIERIFCKVEREIDNMSTRNKSKKNTVSVDDFFEWSGNILTAILHMNIYSQQRCESGEFKQAMRAVEHIENIVEQYIQCNCTEFTDNPENDQVIFGTIKGHYRSMQIYLKQNNEYGIYLATSSLLNICISCLLIKYGGDKKRKHHSIYASGHLERLSRQIDISIMEEATVNCVNGMGVLAARLIDLLNSNNINSLIDEIGRSTHSCSHDHSHLPMFDNGLAHLAKIEKLLIAERNFVHTERLNILHEHLANACSCVLGLKETDNRKTISIHEQYLSDYCAVSDGDARSVIINECRQMSELNNRERDILLKNVFSWASCMLNTSNLILSKAVSSRSTFTNVLINWTLQLSNAVFCVSAQFDSSECNSSRINKLQLLASKILGVSTSMPMTTKLASDRSIIIHLFNNGIIESYSRSVVAAIYSSQSTYSTDAYHHLLAWILRTGMHPETNGILVRGLLSSSYLSVMLGDRYVLDLKRQIKMLRDKCSSFQNQILLPVAKSLRMYSNNHDDLCKIKNEIGASDIDVNHVSSCIVGIADIIEGT